MLCVSLVVLTSRSKFTFSVQCTIKQLDHVIKAFHDAGFFHAKRMIWGKTAGGATHKNPPIQHRVLPLFETSCFPAYSF